MVVLAVGDQVALMASAMVVACGGRATSGRSRAAGARTRPTGSWLHSVESEVVLVVLEWSVMLLVLVLLLVVVCVWVLVLVHRRLEAEEVLGPYLQLPIRQVLEELAR